MADELHVKGKDLKDLKVVELKKELAERHLTVTGNKSELIARLEDYFLKQGDEQEEIEVEVSVFDNEIENIGGDLEQEISEDTYDDEQEESSEPESKNEQSDEKAEVQIENIPPVIEPAKIQLNSADKTNTEIKKVPLDLTRTETERKANRQQRFGIPMNEKQKKEARAERRKESLSEGEDEPGYKINSDIQDISATLSCMSQPVRFGTDEKTKGGNLKLAVGSTENAVDIEKLSRRAERFGAVSPHVTKITEQEKIKKRKERFGLATSGLSKDAEARKKMRAERFKQA